MTRAARDQRLPRQRGLGLGRADAARRRRLGPPLRAAAPRLPARHPHGHAARERPRRPPLPRRHRLAPRRPLQRPGGARRRPRPRPRPARGPGRRPLRHPLRRAPQPRARPLPRRRRAFSPTSSAARRPARTWAGPRRPTTSPSSCARCAWSPNGTSPPPPAPPSRPTSPPNTTPSPKPRWRRVATPAVPVLRDYHAENLLWLPRRRDHARVGMLDYQDMLLGHPAYDLVSLLEDARRDTTPALRAAMLARYLDLTGADPEAFTAAASPPRRPAQPQESSASSPASAAATASRATSPTSPASGRTWPRDLAHPALAPLAAFVTAHVPAPTPEVSPASRPAA